MTAAKQERTIKRRIKDILQRHNVFWYMPVQYGYGAAGVDFHCVVEHKGQALAFFIEAKTTGEPLTQRQKLFLEQRKEQQRAMVFVIDDEESLQELDTWLEQLNERKS